MTFQQFNKLSASEQEIAMWYIGVPIADRFDRIYRYLLFQLDAFYVEIAYAVNLNIITRLTAFDNTELLEPYLEEMQIDINWEE
ncbi:MAG: hypothetical protein EOO01_22500 [Chitinophagaceae bacterium]|nr:MAG: hypothetical protein EOO01_22500 [Chitinophagaceae bacterium]